MTRAKGTLWTETAKWGEGLCGNEDEKMVSDKLTECQGGNMLEWIWQETPGFITSHGGETLLELSNDT